MDKPVGSGLIGIAAIPRVTALGQPVAQSVVFPVPGSIVPSCQDKLVFEVVAESLVFA